MKKKQLATPAHAALPRCFQHLQPQQIFELRAVFFKCNSKRTTAQMIEDGIMGNELLKSWFGASHTQPGNKIRFINDSITRIFDPLEFLSTVKHL